MYVVWVELIVEYELECGIEQVTYVTYTNAKQLIFVYGLPTGADGS